MLKLTKTLTACKDDELIIKRMKKRGVWNEMQKGSKPNICCVIISGDNLFVWHGGLGDSGYSHFRSANRLELLKILTKLNQTIPPRNKMH